MRDGVTRAIALLLATVLALAARAEVATNCFRLVTYQPGAIYHLEVKSLHAHSRPFNTATMITRNTRGRTSRIIMK